LSLGERTVTDIRIECNPGAAEGSGGLPGTADHIP